MIIIGNYCRRIKSWVETLLTNGTVDAKLKSVNIEVGEAYKQGAAIILRIKDLNTFCGVDAGNVTTGNYNNFMGNNAGYSNTSGEKNNFMGNNAGKANRTGSYNNFMGYYAGFNTTTGARNNFMGGVTGYSNTTGSYNNFMGNNAGYSNIAGSYNNFMGNNAGYYETGSNKLFIDNIKRADETDGRVKALIYGMFDAATANQLVRLNAKKVEMPQLGDYANDAAAATGGIAVGGLYHTAGNVKVRVA